MNLLLILWKREELEAYGKPKGKPKGLLHKLISLPYSLQNSFTEK